MQPRQRPLHIPTMHSQAAAMRCVAPRNDRSDVQRAQPFPMGFTIVPTVTLHPVGAKAWTASSSQDEGNRFDQRLQLSYIVDVRGSYLRYQRDALSIGQDVMLATCFGPICGVRTCLNPPKTALTEELSTSERDQSILCSACKSESRSWCSSIQTPADCQFLKRRQQVIPEPQPNSCGRSSHAIPVLRIKRMPVRALRSSTGLRPGNRVRRGLGGGRSGWMISQSSSDKIGLAIARSLSLMRKKSILSTKYNHSIILFVRRSK